MRRTFPHSAAAARISGVRAASRSAADQNFRRELTDPRDRRRLADTMQALSKAFLNIPVGELKAAVEGREPTAAEKTLTVRDLGAARRPELRPQAPAAHRRRRGR